MSKPESNTAKTAYNDGFLDALELAVRKCLAMESSSPVKAKRDAAMALAEAIEAIPVPEYQQ
jgi:hypothetical protein